MKNDLSLDALRGVGMKLVGILVVALAAIIGLEVGLIAPSHWPAFALAVLLAIMPCTLVLGGRIDSQARMIVSITVVAMPALLLYVSEGQAWQTDLHLLFFAILAVTAILCDWKVVAAATAVVGVHHLGFGLIAGSWVFAGATSVLRILLHAAILLVEAGTLMWVAVRIVALIEANEQAVRDREVAAAALASDRARQAATVETVTAALGNGLTALATGDLTNMISVEFDGLYASLKRDFNATVAGLRTMIASVSESTNVIQGGSVEIAQAAENLARRTEANAASLEETSAALLQVESRVRGVAAAAADTVSRADQATATVSLGRTRADAAKLAMDRVSDSARGIDSVIEGLDKIAFQTRVLAMNAAVEAGRAGDAGRGFAVVADLVSALAMRAEEEAKRARDQLTVTQAEIVAAVTAVGTVEGALTDIANDVGAVHALLGSMASDNEAQALAVTEITVAVGSMDRVTQQNAAMVEETAAAARALTAEVAILADAAAGFDTGDSSAVTQHSTMAAPSKSPKPAGTIVRTKAKSRLAVNGALAAVHAPSGNNDWTYF